jgi:hypothetical protein
MIGRGRSWGVGCVREADRTEHRTGHAVDQTAGLSKQMAGGSAGGQAGAGEEEKAETGHGKQIQNEYGMGGGTAERKSDWCPDQIKEESYSRMR